MTMIYYAGIGSRKTPDDVCVQMRDIGYALARQDLTLRSGRALRADSAFEMGCELANGPKEIFQARDAVGQFDWHSNARLFHPLWKKLTSGERHLHARNSAIMLGADLNMPVRFVLCWTPSGEVKGGTGQALRIASALKIPVFNLFNPGDVYAWIGRVLHGV